MILFREQRLILHSYRKYVTALDVRWLKYIVWVLFIFIANMDIAVLQSVSIGLAVHLPTHNIIPACKAFHSVKLNACETLSMQVNTLPTV